MEFIGKFNLNDNPELESLMGHNLKPIKVYYAGNYEQEQVVIEVCHDCYLSDYALVQIVRNEEDLPNYARCHFLTFDEIELFEGDTVKVMTCHGEDHEEKDRNGHTTHIIYWNLPAPVWKEDENEVMIMERGNSITSYLKSSSSKEN
jgi:hypothetical protein